MNYYSIEKFVVLLFSTKWEEKEINRGIKYKKIKSHDDEAMKIIQKRSVLMKQGEDNEVEGYIFFSILKNHCY